MRSGVIAAGLGVLGAVALVYPAVILGLVEAEPYEMEIARWTGLGLIGAATMWAWAQQRGFGVARRLRRWLRTAAFAGLLFLLSTNPIFLVVAFALLTAGVLDTMLERVTIAAYELMSRLRSDEA